MTVYKDSTAKKTLCAMENNVVIINVSVDNYLTKRSMTLDIGQTTRALENCFGSRVFATSIIGGNMHLYDAVLGARGFASWGQTAIVFTTGVPHCIVPTDDGIACDGPQVWVVDVVPSAYRLAAMSATGDVENGFDGQRRFAYEGYRYIADWMTGNRLLVKDEAVIVLEAGETLAKAVLGLFGKHRKKARKSRRPKDWWSVERAMHMESGRWSDNVYNLEETYFDTGYNLAKRLGYSNPTQIAAGISRTLFALRDPLEGVKVGDKVMFDLEDAGLEFDYYSIQVLGDKPRLVVTGHSYVVFTYLLDGFNLQIMEAEKVADWADIATKF